GDLCDHESLVKAIKQVDVVISTVGHALLADQVKIIAAIKEASNVKPPQNVITLNELTSLWEKKTGKNLERIYVPEEQFLKNIQEASFPLNAALSISHTAFVKGDHTTLKLTHQLE
ncbi:hypothetical protein HAX54_049997, partial [Datura stramonium]|nr:hypothetical protein [Datura stramonium]